MVCNPGEIKVFVVNSEGNILGFIVMCWSF